MSTRDDLIRKFIEKYDAIVETAMGTTFTDAKKLKVAAEKKECVERLLDEIEKLESPPRSEVLVINIDLFARLRDATPEGRDAARRWLADHPDKVS